MSEQEISDYYEGYDENEEMGCHKEY
jgi:hypothetical protein